MASLEVWLLSGDPGGKIPSANWWCFQIIVPHDDDDKTVALKMMKTITRMTEEWTEFVRMA